MIEVILGPRELDEFQHQDLSRSTCVVFDILRATSSMVAALNAGAEAIIPVSQIPEALNLHQRHSHYLLAGERGGLRITSHQTGGLDFHCGNSPREFTPEKVAGKIIVMTTTNGTRALKSCQKAAQTFVGSFLNLSVTVQKVAKTLPEKIYLICAGTEETSAYEDVAAAGNFIQSMLKHHPVILADSARVCLEVFQTLGTLEEIGQKSRNGRRLLGMEDLADDVAFCLRADVFPLVAQMSPEGVIKRES